MRDANSISGDSHQGGRNDFVSKLDDVNIVTKRFRETWVAVGQGCLMRTLFLIVSCLCLLTACSATQSGRAPTNIADVPTRVEVSKFQPGEERDSIVKEIGDPDVVSDQANGDRCEVYGVDTTAQGTFRHRLGVFAMGVNPQEGFVVPGAFPPDYWNRIGAGNGAVVFCYKNEKLFRVIAKPCPSAACKNASSSQGFGPAPAASASATK